MLEKKPVGSRKSKGQFDMQSESTKQAMSQLYYGRPVQSRLNVFCIYFVNIRHKLAGRVRRHLLYIKIKTPEARQKSLLQV